MFKSQEEILSILKERGYKSMKLTKKEIVPKKLKLIDLEDNTSSIIGDEEITKFLASLLK